MTLGLVFDDAAIFPPGDLGLPQAVAAHRRHRTASYAHWVGPLVVGATDLEELADLTEGRDDPEEVPLEIAVVVDDAEGAAAALEAAWRIDGVRLAALEVRDTTPELISQVCGEPLGVTVYVELPRQTGRRTTLIPALARTPYAAKIRTGGPVAAMHPDEHELASAVVALARAGVGFKATAGLHHALRNTDPATGFEQHGVVNLLLAVQAATRGADVEAVTGLLAERDPARLPAPSTLSQRSLLRSIGTCSISDSVAELSAWMRSGGAA